MKRREFLQAGLGAVVAASLLPRESLAGVTSEGLALGENGPVYQIDSNPALNLSDAVTLEAWVKATPMPEGGGRILDKLV